MFRKSACPFGQVKTEMYLPESPFFKNSLAEASGLVLMSVPVGVLSIKAMIGKNIWRGNATISKIDNSFNILWNNSQFPRLCKMYHFKVHTTIYIGNLEPESVYLNPHCIDECEGVVTPIRNHSIQHPAPGSRLLEDDLYMMLHMSSRR